MRSGLLTFVCWTMLAWNAFAQERIGRAKYELIRETINFLATDTRVSQDTVFRISCETLDYGCFGQQLADNPIAGIEQWYNRWRAVTTTDENSLKTLKERIFADIFERPGKGYRKQLAGYGAYNARMRDLIASPEEAGYQERTVDDTLLEERVPDHAGPQPIYPEQVIDQTNNPENTNNMIAYLAIAIGLTALVIAALPFIRKKEPDRPVQSAGLEELHLRLDGIALRMKNLEQRVSDAQMADAMAHLTEIMESVERRVVELERRAGQ